MDAKEARKAIEQVYQETGFRKNQVQSLFAMERLLFGLSRTSFQDHIILKGGFLLALKHGLTERTTVDVDFTLKHVPLSDEVIEQMIVEVNNQLADFEEITLQKIRATRDDFQYNGYKVSLSYSLNGKVFNFKVDLTTGEKLIDENYKEELNLLFENQTIELYSYPVEQIMSDKFQTVIAFGSVDDTNSRMKDYYDIYVMNQLYKDLNYDKVYQSVKKTMKQRGTDVPTQHFIKVLDFLQASQTQQNYWERFKERYPYASDISFVEVMAEIKLVNQKIVEVEENRNN